PSGGPNRGCPSAQRGVGPAGPCGGGAGVTVKTLFPVASTTNELLHTWLLPFLATMPCTVTASPILTVSLVHPLLRRSTVLSNSIAQIFLPFGVCVSMKMWTCGFSQSIFVTVPFKVIDLAGSNFAAGTWCADSGNVPSKTARNVPNKLTTAFLNTVCKIPVNIISPRPDVSFSAQRPSVSQIISN